VDCASALRLNVSNIKAYYRSASALLGLSKFPEAVDAVNRGLTLDPTNASLKKLSSQISIRQAAAENLAAKRRSEEERKAKEALTLRAALSARGIILKSSSDKDKAPDLQDAVIHLSPDPLSATSLLEFPALFLYPLHAQSDFVKAFAEKDKIIDHLSYLIPLPWDTGGEYTVAGVECYMDAPTGGMIKVGKKLSLLQVLADGKTVVLDGMVKIYAVPAVRASGWISEMKKRKGK